MKREDAEAWAAGWREVERAEIAELRNLPAEVKLRQIEALAEAAFLFHFPPGAAQKEDDRTRDLWVKLRQRSGIR